MAMVKTQAGVDQGGSYYPGLTQTGYEKQAGVTPQYFSVLDENGQVKSPFQADPTKSAAFQQMQTNAMSTDTSPWALMQQQALKEQTQNALDASNTQSLGSTDQAMSQLMATGGGMSSGAAQNLAMQGQRTGTMAGQNIRNQQTAQDIAIRQGDAQNKQQMLGQVANAETGAQAANAQTGINDFNNQNIFQANRYNQQMAAWGAGQTAAAQQAAAGGKK